MTRGEERMMMLRRTANLLLISLLLPLVVGEGSTVVAGSEYGAKQIIPVNILLEKYQILMNMKYLMI